MSALSASAWRPADAARHAASPGELAGATVLAAAAAAGPRLGPAVRALVLTGSMARGEATVSRSRNGWRVHGDAEFLARLAAGARPALAAAQARQAIAQELAERGIECPVSVAPASRHYLRHLRPHIFGCELKAHGRVAWGPPDALADIPALAASAIPPEDGWHLLSNRMIEFLEAARRKAPAEPAPELVYAAVKLGLDLGTSLLVATGSFEPGYRARRRALERWVRGRAALGNGLPLAEIGAAVSICTDWKLGAMAWPPPGSARLVPWIVELAYQLWAWQLHRLAGGAPEAAPAVVADWPANWRRHAARQGAPARLRGWLHLWRARQAWRAPRLWGYWAQMAMTASPRLWVYRAAAEALPEYLAGSGPGAFPEPRPPRLPDPSLAPALAPSLAPAPARASGRGGPAAWEHHAGAIAAHYHAYLEDTRS